MAVYYKFKSAKDFDSVPIEGHFIQVGHLKEKIFEIKHLGRGTDFDLVVTNAQTNEEYLDEGMLIPKNTSVLIRRVPGRPRKPIVTAPVTEQEEPNVQNNSDDIQVAKSSFTGAEAAGIRYDEDFGPDGFGDDLYAIPEVVPVQSSISVQDAPPVSKEDEESKIKALIDTPALDWQRQPSDGFAPGRGYARVMGGRNMGGRGFGRGGFEKKTPPQGYICHRCKIPGHFIQHCPTNGDPSFDIKRMKQPTGIPKSMLMATPDGSYALPSGDVAVLKPNEAAFEKEIEGMPSTRSVGDLPPELHCPLCKEVMKDAILTSKCCFNSFCDKCIRDYIISNSRCVCDATNVLADDLLPNKTLRDTINRILESNNSSAENGGSAFQLQDMESRNPPARVPSPTQSAASKGQKVSAPAQQREEPSKAGESEEDKAVNFPQTQEKVRILKVPDVSEATHDSRSVKETASQGSAQLADEEVQQKPVPGEAGKKKKKKKIRMPPGAAEMPWRTGQELVPGNYMMPLGPSAFNPPYWNGIQPGFDGFIPPYPGPVPYMGYGLGPMDPFGGILPQDPFGGPMLPYGPPQRDLAELAIGYNPGPPILSREEFEAHKADLKRKREMGRHEREMTKDREYGRESSSTVDVPPMKKSKSKPVPPPPSVDGRRNSPERRRSPPKHRSRDPELPPPSKKKFEDDHPEDHHRQRRDYRDDSRHHHRDSGRHRQRSESPVEPQLPSTSDKKQKASVFSRISFPEKDSKKRKLSSSESISNGYHEEHKAAAAISASVDHNSSDDERHFKRRPSRYTSSPREMEEEKERMMSKDRDRGKHR